MQKSKILNIGLALIILVLAVMLTQKKETMSVVSLPTPVTIDSVGKTSSVNNFEKKSLGITSALYPKPALVIGSYDKDGKPNMMTAAWVSIANSDPLSIAVSMRPATYSYHNLTDKKFFTVNIPSEELTKYVSYVGKYSGRDMDKFKETGLTPVRAEFVDAPYIKEFPIVFECELTEYHDLGSHRQFIGKVIDVKADKAVLGANGAIDMNLLKPIVYANGGYYRTGSFIGMQSEMFKQVDGQPFIPSVKQTYLNETLKTIHNRKSVRHFTDAPVSKAQLEILVKAGMASPTAVNRQSWAFYVVTDKAILMRLSEQLPYGKMLAYAQAAIVVCGDMEKAGNLKDKDYWVHDCAAASENILLAAESIGLGAVWTAAFPYDDRTIAVIKELNLPEKHIPLNVIPIGYPTGEDQANDKWKSENLIWK